MTLILLGKGLVLRGWPSKIEVIGVFSVIREWTGKKSPSSSCGRVALPPWFLGKWPAESFEEKVNTGEFLSENDPSHMRQMGLEYLWLEPFNDPCFEWKANNVVLKFTGPFRCFNNRTPSPQGPNMEKLIPTITLSINLCLRSLIWKQAPSCQYIR